MITHLFYHQEKVEEQCAVNSWQSIRNWFGKDDEIIILDLGNTLKSNLEFGDMYPKYINIEKIRTDTPQERSYTYGLNRMIPKARHEWVCLWRSDYIYSNHYYDALLSGMEGSNVVLPYECFIGKAYCDSQWCFKNLDHIMNCEAIDLLNDSAVCPVYENMDFPHFAIKKDLWIKSGGMDDRLWGYGWQFPELFCKLKKTDDYNPSVQFNMLAFHQAHFGSFGANILDNEKLAELRQVERKLMDVFGSPEACKNFLREIKQPALRPRYDEKYYII